MHNTQFDGERNSNEDIQSRLYFEHHTLSAMDGGLPDDESNLCELIHDAYRWIIQAKQAHNIPDRWHVPEEDHK